jgi:hypothetical protein
MSKQWIFPATQNKPEIKIAYGSKVVKTSEELKTSKYFDLKNRRENPIYFREEEFGGIAQRGAVVYLLNKPATMILKKYLAGYRGAEIKILKDFGMIL